MASRQAPEAGGDQMEAPSPYGAGLRQEALEDDGVVPLASQVALLATRAGADGVAELVRRADRRSGSSTARICVVGGTNVGKSRLVNELVGTTCVHVSVRPTSGPPVLVTARETAADATSDSLEVVVPRVSADSWLVRSGIEFVDTAGWESWSGTREPDSEALARIVVDCDAVVVVTEARRALLATEQARLQALSDTAHHPPLLVAVSKLDEVGDEAAEIMKRVRHLVHRLAPNAPVLAAPVTRTATRPGGSWAERTHADEVEVCRTMLAALSGARERAALRAARRLRLLAATCGLVTDAAARALAAGASPQSNTFEERVAEIWRARHTAARFRWIVLADQAQERCRKLTEAIAAEARRRRADLIRVLSEKLSRMVETPEEQLFVRLHVVPITEQAMEEFAAWTTGTVDEALRRDTDWLLEALRHNRPDDQDTTITTPHARHVVPVPRLPQVAGTAAAEEAEDAAGWDASWAPDFVGSTLDSVISPFATELVGGVVGAAGTALTTELLERGQAERRHRTVEVLGSIVEQAFAEQSERLGTRLTEVYEHQLASARDRDEEWWGGGAAPPPPPPPTPGPPRRRAPTGGGGGRPPRR
ncbi:GTPase, partial [Streptomyces sp. NPDC127108]|uniref:GTPase n=1 Tax=Streptomyces sp. NPDC127108 TaxID=3345361 RepID=UPI00363C2690